jgi:WhiB family transcriptional regulator, redox-sensing transcriptional regulator
MKVMSTGPVEEVKEIQMTELAANLSSTELATVFGLPEEQSWQERSLCAQTDPEAFFPEKGGSTREAKKICVGCEVRAECLEYALANDERFGIWGGLSERERRRLKRVS